MSSEDDLAMKEQYFYSSSPISLSGEELEGLRNRFYPGWWTYPPETRSSLQPFFRVVCGTEADLALARLAKPPFVRAEIVHRAAVSDTRVDRAIAELVDNAKRHGFTVGNTEGSREALKELHASFTGKI